MSENLDYLIAEDDEARMVNMDRMMSDDPTEAATARCNRDLVNWFENELERDTTPGDVSIAFIHGVTSVFGTMLLQLPEDARPGFHEMIRKHFLMIYDEMGEALTKGKN